MVTNNLVAPGTDPNAALATAAAIYGPPPSTLDPVPAGTATAMVMNGLVAPGTDPTPRWPECGVDGPPAPGLDPGRRAPQRRWS